MIIWGYSLPPCVALFDIICTDGELLDYNKQ